MEPITKFTAKAVSLPATDVDTDQIIPARFLKTIDKEGLGKQAFYDWRYDESGAEKPDFVLNTERGRGAGVLIAGNNFGCGSSREHAPWALMGAGLKAVVSTSFADIFRGNSLKNGLLPIVVDAATLAELLVAGEADPAPELTVDLATQSLTLPDGRVVEFPIDDFSKKCLLAGMDQLGYIQGQEAAIAAYEASHAGRVSTV